MIEQRTLRSFGFIVGGILIVAALAPLADGSPVRTWTGVPGAVLVVLASTFPELLRWPFRGWMLLGGALGWINTRILLSAIFFALVTPLALLLRLFGRDQLMTGRAPAAVTYRVAKPPRDLKHYERMF